MLRIKIKKNLISSRGPMVLDACLEIETGCITVLTGQSGSGKTTLLRILSGLAKPEEGFIASGDITWLDTEKGVCVSPQKRKIGYVSQDLALFPNMTVLGNMLYADPDRRKAMELLERAELSKLAQAYPQNLSGGQKQRLAMVRAISRETDLLLLDEPLSALDHASRLRLQDEIFFIHEKFGITIILVSHDLQEIYRLGKRVLFMEYGRVVRDGSPAEVFINTATSHKFSFAGDILEIKSADVFFIATIGIGGNICRVILTAREANSFKEGDRVLIASKAFDPVLIKI